MLLVYVLSALSLGIAWVAWGSPESTSSLRRAVASPFLALPMVLFPIFGESVLNGFLSLVIAVVLRVHFMPLSEIRLLVAGERRYQDGSSDDLNS